MSHSADPLIEERVAQLQEIRRRRNELVTEMYLLLKRKDDLGNILTVDENAEGLQAFVKETDIVERPEYQHVKELLLPLPEAVAQIPRSRQPSPRTVSRGSTRVCSRAASQVNESTDRLASPVSEHPLSPQTQETPGPETDAPPAGSSLDTMEVDEVVASEGTQPPTSRLPSASPAPVPSASQKRRSRSTTASLQPELRATPKPRESKSRSPPAIQTDDIPPSSLAEGEISRELGAQPTPQVDDILRVHLTSEATKTEEGMEDVIMHIPPDPPLPTARVDSQQSASEYVLEAQVSPDPPPPAFTFGEEVIVKTEVEEKTIAPAQTLYVPPDYTLPPLKALPPEFHRKGKQRQSRKRDKEKMEMKSSQEWTPLGLNRWAAMLRANPVHKKISKATKCLSTREWNVIMTEMKLIKTFDRIDALVDAGRWSFRQPKKQRGVGGLTKTHWDYLLDEMKWMRIDFREERKWKMALAHNLAHAVLEWHEAGSLEERVRRGICVLWKRPRETEETQEGPSQEGELHAFVRQDNEAHSGATSKGESTPVVDDNSDDESDEEQERDRQDVVDALDPATALQEAFEDAEFLLENQSSQDVQPKLEYVEDTSALQGAASETTMQVDAAPTGEPSAEAPKSEAAEPSGLKANSGNPMFGAQDASADSGASSSKPKLKSSLLAPLREQIVFSEVEKLFLDLDDFDLVKGMSSLSTEDPSMSAPPPLPDLSEIFPDMQPLGLLDVPPVMSSDGKKKSGRGDRDDPNKRAEDTTYMKVLPANEYMLHKATLLGPLQPSKHWDQDHWHDLDDSVIITENDIPPKAVDDSYMCSLFDSGKASPSSTPAILPPFPREGSRRPAHHYSLLENSRNPTAFQKSKASELVWSSQDDMLLKQLVEKYGSNWILIAETFNTLRDSISVDHRTPADCFDRFRTRWGGPSANAEDDHRPPPTPTTQMTTRGTKRSMSMSVASPTAGASGSAQGNETSKKRRRHTLMYDAIRKAAKKREAAQKQSAANQRKPTSIHDTHGQYNKMPKLTPAELSRMKAEKDARESQENAIARKRQEELRQLQIQQQQQRLQQLHNMQQAGQTPAIRTPNGHPGAQGMPQIRSQVNISGQQQRISNPLLGNTRIASSQVMQTQAQAQAQAQARAIAAAQAQAVVQGQGQAHAGIASSLAAGAAPALTAHLSPAYNAARASSTSPGLPQQSPPLPQAVAANATSPRPPSAQALAGLTPQQVQASLAQGQRTAVPPMAHYYSNVGALPNMQTGQFTPEQLSHALQIRTLISQQQAALQQQQQQQQQQAQQQAQQPQQPQQQNTSYMSQ